MALPDQLEVIEKRQFVSSYSEIIFRVDVANQMTAPTTGSLVEVIDLNTGDDVIGTVSTSTAITIESTTFVKLPKLSGFTANREYSVRFAFADSDNKLPGEIRLGCLF